MLWLRIKREGNSNKLKKVIPKRAVIFSLFILIAALAYAIIRYNIIKGDSWSKLPLFVSNKAIALSAVVFIAISFLLGPLARFWPRKFVSLLYLRKYFGLLGFGLAAVHTLISLLLFTPGYYPKFFSIEGKLNFVGELSMLFGVLAFFIFLIIAVTSIPSVEALIAPKRWKTIQRLGYLAFVFVMLHVAIMGAAGWLKPEGWPGGLLPISLIAFVVILVTLLIRIIVFVLPF